MSAVVNERDAELERILAAARHMAEKLNVRIDVDPTKARVINFSANYTPEVNEGRVVKGR